MQTTFITYWQAFFTLVTLGCGIAIYFLYVRPSAEGIKGFHGFDGKIKSWLKARWDVVSAFAIAIAPILWNGALDGVIFLSLLLEQFLPALAGADLSKLVIPDWIKDWIPMAATLVPAIRAVINMRKNGDE